MSTLFATLLGAHVISGILGTICVYGILLTLLKTDVDNAKFRRRSLLAWFSFMTSWFTGGYYYWFYYGPQVKPVIKAGEFPWAHTVVMEAKEHIFLLLPILTAVLYIIARWCSERMQNDAPFKTSVVMLTSVTCTLAILVTLAGVIISGGAR